MNNSSSQPETEVSRAEIPEHLLKLSSGEKPSYGQRRNSHIFSEDMIPPQMSKESSVASANHTTTFNFIEDFMTGHDLKQLVNQLGVGPGGVQGGMVVGGMPSQPAHLQSGKIIS